MSVRVVSSVMSSPTSASPAAPVHGSLYSGRFPALYGYVWSQYRREYIAHRTFRRDESDRRTAQIANNCQQHHPHAHTVSVQQQQRRRMQQLQTQSMVAHYLSHGTDT
jgi:hypothetical protein